MRVVFVVLAVLAAACGGGRERSAPAETTGAREVTNLRAFARLYGVVRWFHPSDEAADVDWNTFAVNGVSAVRGAPDRKALVAALDALVQPIGAGIVIGTADEVARSPALPVDETAEMVAWQHVGPGFDGGGDGPYLSKRTSRPGSRRSGGDWGAFAQAVDATAWRGQRVRLRGALAAGKHSRAGLWLRVDREGGASGFFDNMKDRAVVTAAWQRAAIEGDVAVDAARVVVGGIVWGQEGWFDDLALEVGDGKGGWTPVALGDADFERGAGAWSVGMGKASQQPGDGFVLAVEAHGDGASPAAHLRVPTMPLVVDPFATRPAAGEAVIVDLGDGLQARVPIALASVDGHTVPAAKPGTAAPVTPQANALAIADVIVAWNAFAHFYPYLDVIATDWHAHLDQALAGAIAAGADPSAGREALRRVLVAAEDGHGFLRTEPMRAYLPLEIEEVEGKLVVVASSDGGVQRGDELVTIDGEPAPRALAAQLARFSGSRQWRTLHALRAMGGGADGSRATLQLRRGGTLVSAVVPRGVGVTPPLYTYPPIGEVEPGVWLVDLARVEVAALGAKMDALAAARGVVFDVRGYPNGTHGVLAHLMDAPEHDRWMHMPEIIRPNLPGHALPAHTWDSVGWNLAPIAPRFRGKVVFLTGPGAISYAESVMGYVEAMGLPIVGAATAGTNGNIREVSLPSGAAFVFTGMKVTRHDGSRFHLEGVRPTVPAARTIAGVTAGKDEVLERGLALVR